MKTMFRGRSGGGKGYGVFTQNIGNKEKQPEQPRTIFKGVQAPLDRPTQGMSQDIHKYSTRWDKPIEPMINVRRPVPTKQVVVTSRPHTGVSQEPRFNKPVNKPVLMSNTQPQSQLTTMQSVSAKPVDDTYNQQKDYIGNMMEKLKGKQEGWKKEIDVMNETRLKPQYEASESGYADNMRQHLYGAARGGLTGGSVDADGRSGLYGQLQSNRSGIAQDGAAFADTEMQRRRSAYMNGLKPMVENYDTRAKINTGFNNMTDSVNDGREDSNLQTMQQLLGGMSGHYANYRNKLMQNQVSNLFQG